MEYVNCNLCGSDDTELLYPSTLAGDLSKNNAQRYRCTSRSYGLHPPIVRCKMCGLVYANPRREGGIILDNYKRVVDDTYLEERKGRVLTFRRNLRPLEELVSPADGPRLLDVGCYTGVFLGIAQGRGWEAWGVEPSRWAVREARRRGLRVAVGTLREAEFPDDFFDVVTMWDVIEHFTDPMGELREVKRILKRDGVVCIHTMNIESTFARLMGNRWPWLMEMHLYYFSPRTLAMMSERAGFQVIGSLTQGRFLRLGYLISRLEPYSRVISRGLTGLVRMLGLATVPISINLGDLFTTYARKVE